MHDQSRKTAISTVAIIGGTISVAGYALAQEQSPPVNERLTLEQITVTGTRLRNPDAWSSSPVAVVDVQDLASTGNAVEVENFLNELPQFAPGTSGQANRFGEIMSTADLRGLGPQRTLVLVNGRRYISATATGLVDINTIPASLIERVDVVTGGASAVYGSDALAGVVNFVLKREFAGLQFGGNYKVSERGDAAASNLSATLGGDFADGRGNAVVALNYTKRDPLTGADRAFATPLLRDSTCAPGSLGRFGVGTRSTATDAVPCYILGGSGGTEAGVLNGAITFNDDGSARPFNSAADFYNFNPGNYLQLPLERWSATLLMDYELNDNASVYVQSVGIHNTGVRELAAVSTLALPTPRFNVNLANPFLSPGTLAFLTPLDTDGDGIVAVNIGRRMSETGARAQELVQSALQLQSGVRGAIGDSWSYDAYAQLMRNDRTDTVQNDIAQSRFQQSLLAVTDSTGRPVCIDRSNNCAPANIFGAGNVSEQASRFLRTLSSRKFDSEEYVLAGSLTGDTSAWFELPAGAPALAIGAEYRSVEVSDTPDFVWRSETMSQTRTQPLAGDFQVSELFGEVQVPILKDAPLARSLSIKAAARTSDYSTVGRVFTWNGGIEWTPVGGLRLRAELQRAIRAPNVSELFQGADRTFSTLADPCSDRTPLAQRTAALAELCVATGVPAALVFGPIQPTLEVQSLVSGNAQLKEEESETFTAGFVFTPSWLEGLHVSMDYYDIDITDAIGRFGGSAANVLNTCYSVLRSATTVYCQSIQRDPSLGSIAQINQQAQNIARLHTSGIDLFLQYGFDTSFGIGGASRFTTSVRGTWLHDIQTQAEPITDILECVGLFGPRCGEPKPEWKTNTMLAWQSGPLRLTAQWRWLDGVLADNQVRFANPATGATYRLTPGTALSRKIDPTSYLDLSGQWEITERLSLLAGVENVTDEDPPVLSAAVEQQNNTWPGTYNPIGRTFFVSAQASF